LIVGELDTNGDPVSAMPLVGAPQRAKDFMPVIGAAHDAA